VAAAGTRIESVSVPNVSVYLFFSDSHSPKAPQSIRCIVPSILIQFPPEPINLERSGDGVNIPCTISWPFAKLVLLRSLAKLGGEWQTQPTAHPPSEHTEAVQS